MKRSLLPVLGLMILLNISPASAQSYEIQAISPKTSLSQTQVEAARERLRQIRQARQTSIDQAEAPKIEVQATQAKREIMINRLNSVMNILQRQRQRTRSYWNRPKPEQKASAEKIERNIQFFQNKREELQKANTPERVQNTSRDIRAHWQENKTEVVSTVHRNQAARVKTMVNRLDSVVDRIERKLGMIKGDTRGLSQQLNTLRNMIQSARQDSNNADQAFDRGDVNQGQQYLRQAQSTLKRAHAVMKKLVEEMRNKYSVVMHLG